MNKADFENSIKDFIKQFNTYICWKNTQLKYVYCNQQVANIMGYANINSVIGITDFDIKTENVNSAELFQRQDRYVLSNHCNLSSIEVMRDHKNDYKILLATRFPFYCEDELMGVIISATEVNDLYLKNFKFKTKKHKPKSYRYKSYEIVGNDLRYKKTELTLREMECIFHILRGKSANETAAQLNLSSRTVENYLYNIKSKLNCQKKSELIEKALSLGYQYYIPQSFLQGII